MTSDPTTVPGAGGPAYSHVIVGEASPRVSATPRPAGRRPGLARAGVFPA
ncbi:hypothetical protein [Corynebacterium sp.]